MTDVETAQVEVSGGVKVRCRCGEVYSFPEDSRGKTFLCKKCRRVFTVPRKRMSSALKVLLWLVALLVALAGGGAVGLHYLGYTVDDARSLLASGPAAHVTVPEGPAPAERPCDWVVHTRSGGRLQGRPLAEAVEVETAHGVLAVPAWDVRWLRPGSTGAQTVPEEFAELVDKLSTGTDLEARMAADALALMGQDALPALRHAAQHGAARAQRMAKAAIEKIAPGGDVGSGVGTVDTPYLRIVGAIQAAQLHVMSPDLGKVSLDWPDVAYARARDWQSDNWRPPHVSELSANRRPTGRWTIETLSGSKDVGALDMPAVVVRTRYGDLRVPPAALVTIEAQAPEQVAAAEKAVFELLAAQDEASRSEALQSLADQGALGLPMLLRAAACAEPEVAGEARRHIATLEGRGIEHAAAAYEVRTTELSINGVVVGPLEFACGSRKLAIPATHLRRVSVAD